MEVKFNDEIEENLKRVGKIHIAAGKNGATVSGTREEIVKAFIGVCESMAIANVPENILIDIVKCSRKVIKSKLRKVCPRCENIEIGLQDKFCKICGYKL